MFKLILLAGTHLGVLVVGFVLGVYTLPILTAPNSPEAATLAEEAKGSLFQATFKRDLRGSDFLHWGDGQISLSEDMIVHQGKLAPGPDYKLYLLDQFVEHEDEFLALKGTAMVVGDVKSFDGFALSVPDGLSVADYNTVVIWCESFSEFITSAKYQ